MKWQQQKLQHYKRQNPVYRVSRKFYWTQVKTWFWEVLQIQKNFVIYCRSLGYSSCILFLYTPRFRENGPVTCESVGGRIRKKQWILWVKNNLVIKTNENKILLILLTIIIIIIKKGGSVRADKNPRERSDAHWNKRCIVDLTLSDAQPVPKTVIIDSWANLSDLYLISWKRCCCIQCGSDTVLFRSPGQLLQAGLTDSAMGFRGAELPQTAWAVLICSVSPHAGAVCSSSCNLYS